MCLSCKNEKSCIAINCKCLLIVHSNIFNFFLYNNVFVKHRYTIDILYRHNLLTLLADSKVKHQRYKYAGNTPKNDKATTQ